MADIQSNININVDTKNATAAIRNLQAQISAFHQQMQKSGSAANAAASANMQRNLQNSINATGKFAANLTTVKTETEAFTGALEKNKLSMGQYFRYAGASSRTFGRLFRNEFNTISKVAESRVRTLQTQYVKMGRDASGAMKAMAVRPLSLDMQNLSTQTMIAAQKQQIFNQLLRQGSTNLLNFGKNTQWAGRQLMVGFTVPLSIMGATAIKEFQKIEEQVIKLKRVYGDMFTTNAETERAVEQVRQLADEFTKYGIAVESTIGLAASVAQMGNVGADMINQVTEATKLAVLGGMEQEKALDTTISLTNAFGIAAEDLTEKINFLNAAENQTILAIDDFTEAVPKAGSVVAQLGGSVEDLAFFLTAMREGGVNASQAANALKSSLARLVNPTEKAQADLKELGIDVLSIVEGNVGDLRGTIMDLGVALDDLQPLQRSRALEELFGKFQFARMSTLFQNIAKEGSQAQEILRLTRSSAAELQILADRELSRVEESPATKLQKSVEKLQAALAPIGAEFVKLVTPIVEFATNLLKKFNEMGDGAKAFVTGLITVLGLIAPAAIMSFGLIANGIANVMKAFNMYRTFLQRLSGVNSSVATSTDYMTQEQLEATSVATNLGQAHEYLSRQFTVEAGALAQLTDAYNRAIIAQNRFTAGTSAATTASAARPARPTIVKAPTGRRAGAAAGPVGYNKGTLNVPGPRGAGDIVPAVLSPGEAVIPAKQSQKYSGFLKAIMNDEVPGMMFGGIAGMLGRSRVATRMSSSTFMGSLRSGDTSYKSGFATGTGADFTDRLGRPMKQHQLMRRQAENKLYGTPVGSNDPALRPTYGSVAMSPLQRILSILFGGRKGRQFASVTNPMASSLDQYGDISLIGKRSMSRRASTFAGDTLLKYSKNPAWVRGTAPMRGATPEQLKTAGFGSFDTPFGQNKLPGGGTSVNPQLPYIEAQTMGGFNYNEVSKIVTKNPAVKKQLRQELKAAGLGNIPVSGPGFISNLFTKLGVPGFKDGIFSVPGPKGAGDVVPSMLSPGEAVVPAKQTAKYAGLIKGIISDSIPGFNSGYIYDPSDPPRETHLQTSTPITGDVSNQALVDQLFAAKPGFQNAPDRVKSRTSALGQLTARLPKKLNENLKPSRGGVMVDQFNAAWDGTQDKLVDTVGKGMAELGEAFDPNSPEMKRHIAEYEAEVKANVNRLAKKTGGVITDTELSEATAQANQKLSKTNPAARAAEKRANTLREYRTDFTRSELQKDVKSGRAKLVKTSTGGGKVVDPSTGIPIGRLASKGGLTPQQQMKMLEKDPGFVSRMGLRGDSKFVSPKSTSQSRSTPTKKVPRRARAQAKNLAAKDGQSDAKVYSNEFDAKSQDPYMLARDNRNSPHPQAGKDGADDARAYNKNFKTQSGAPVPPGQRRRAGAPAGAPPPLPTSPGGVPQPGGYTSPMVEPLDTPEGKREAKKSAKGFVQRFGKGVKNAGTSVGKQALGFIEKSSIGQTIVSGMARAGGNTLVGSDGNVMYDAATDTQYDSQGNVVARGNNIAAGTAAATSRGEAGEVSKDALLDDEGRVVTDKKGRVVTKQQAERETRRNASRQKRGMVAGRLGGAMGSASMMLGMTSMMPGVGDNPIMKAVQGFMPALFGLSAVLPLLTALPGPIGLVIAALGALGFGLYKWNETIQKSREEGRELGNALSMSTDKLVEMSKVTGTVSATEIRRKEQEQQLTGTTEGQRQFGMNFLDSEAGSSLMEEINRISSSGLGVDAAAESMGRQLSLAVMQGVLSPEQANSVVAAIGAEMDDYQFSADIQGTMISLIGPNGKDITEEPLEVALAIQEAGTEQISDFQSMIGERFNADFSLFENIMLDPAAAAEFEDMDAQVQSDIRKRASLEEQYGRGGIGGFFAGMGGAFGDMFGGSEAWNEAKTFVEETGGIMANATKLQSAGIQLGIGQIAENQQILDSLNAQYDQQIESLEADIQAEKNAEKRKQLEQDLIDLEKERANAVKTLNAQNASTLDQIVEMRDMYKDTDAFDQAIEKSVLGRFDEDDPMKVFAEETIKTLSLLEDSDFKSNVQLGFASGELSVSNVQSLLNAFEKDPKVSATFDLVSNEQGFGNASQLLTLLGNAGIEGNQLNYALNLFANIESPEEFEDKAQALAEISQLETEFGVKINLEGDNLENKLNAVTGAMADLEDLPNTINKDVLSEVEGNEEIAALLGSWQELMGESDSITKTAIFEFIAMYTDGEDIVTRYLQEIGSPYGPGQMTSEQRTKLRADAVAYFQAQKTAYEEEEEKVKKDDPEGGGPVGSMLDSIVSKLKLVRDETVKFTKGWSDSMEQLMNLFGDDRRITIFDGIQQQLRALGAGENLIQLIAGMDPDEFEKRKNELFTIKNGQIVALKDAALSIGDALNSIKIGEFQDKQEKTLAQMENQETAFQLLRNAGLDVADAYKVIADEALAAAIATGELTDKEIDALISKVESVREKSTIADALEDARKAIEDFNNDIVLEGAIRSYVNSSDFERISGTLVDAQIDGALAASAIMKDESLKALIEAGQAGSEAFTTRLQQVMTSADFLQGIFDKGYANVQESFRVQEAKIRDDFETRLIEGTLASYDFNDMFGLEELSEMVGMSQEEIEELFSLKDPERVIEQAKAQIATLQFEIDDLNAELEEIAQQEEKINEKYDERIEALEKTESINEDIARAQKSQLDIADALSRGDIAAAARAAREERQEAAKARLQQRKDRIEEAREQALNELRSSQGQTKEQIDQRIKDLQEEIRDIEESRLEPAQRLIELSDILINKQLRYDTVLGKTREEWEDIKLEIDLAKIQSDRFVDSIKAALSAVQALINAYKELNEEMKKEDGEKEIPQEFLEEGVTSYTWDPEKKEAVLDEDIKTIGDLPQEEQEFLYDWLEGDGSQSSSSTGGGGASSSSGSTSTSSSVYQAEGVQVKDRDKAASSAISAVKSGQASDPLSFANQVRETVLANREAVRSGTLSNSAKQQLMKDNVNLMQNTGLKFAVGGMVPNLMSGGKIKRYANGGSVDYLSGGGMPTQLSGSSNVGYYPMGGLIPYKRMGGLLPYKANGGLFQSVNTDTVPAMLTPGEFVVRRYAVDKYGVDKLKSINNGTYNGESVYNYELNVNVKSDANPDEIARTVMTKIKQVDSQRMRGNRF